MPARVLRNYFNSNPKQELTDSFLVKLFPYLSVQAQLSSLNILYKAYTAPSKDFFTNFYQSIFIPKIGPRIILFDDLNQNDFMHKADQKAQKIRELQREIDRDTEDFRTFYEELRFTKIHDKLK